MTHDKEYRLCKNNLKKSLNKCMTEAHNKQQEQTWEGGNMISRITLCCSKCPFFKKKKNYKACKETEEV